MGKKRKEKKGSLMDEMLLYLQAIVKGVVKLH